MTCLPSGHVWTWAGRHTEGHPPIGTPCDCGVARWVAPDYCCGHEQRIAALEAQLAEAQARAETAEHSLQFHERELAERTEERNRLRQNLAAGEAALREAGTVLRSFFLHLHDDHGRSTPTMDEFEAAKRVLNLPALRRALETRP